LLALSTDVPGLLVAVALPGSTLLATLPLPGVALTALAPLPALAPLTALSLSRLPIPALSWLSLAATLLLASPVVERRAALFTDRRPALRRRAAVRTLCHLGPTVSCRP